MNKRIKQVLAVTLALMLAFTGLFGIGAYFTGTDVKSDGYTIGEVSVEVLGDSDVYSIQDLTPLQEWSFTRSVKNTGINDAYVYMTVTIPFELVDVANLDGTGIVGVGGGSEGDSFNTQLFQYGTNGAAGVGSEWKLVDAGKYGNSDIVRLADATSSFIGFNGKLLYEDSLTAEYGVTSLQNRTVTYIYAYVGDNGSTLERLAPDAETGVLFDTMKLFNVADTTVEGQIEGMNIEGTNGLIKTEVFAIQADNVLETTLHEGRNDDGSDAVNAVWAVLNNAAVPVAPMEGYVIRDFAITADSAIAQQLLAERTDISFEPINDIFAMDKVMFLSHAWGDEPNSNVINISEFTDENCVDYNAPVDVYEFTGYEIVSEDTDSVLVRFVSDSTNYNGVAYDCLCGFSGFDNTQEIKVIDGKLTILVDFPKI